MTLYIQRQVVRIQENKETRSCAIMCKPVECIGGNGAVRWSNLPLPRLQKPDDWVPRPKTPKKRQKRWQVTLEGHETSDEDADNNKVVDNANESAAQAPAPAPEAVNVEEAVVAAAMSATAAAAATTPEAAAASTSGGCGRAHATVAQARHINRQAYCHMDTYAE